jgi:short-subunit dehydrogenase
VAPIENTSIADFERAMEVMFWGVVYPTLAVLPEMKERGRGRIVTITSIGGKVSVPHLTAYSCAKSAAIAFCEGLHAEMAPQGIHVTTVAPGLMRTGAHVNAQFKGQHASEARWFSAAATLPVLTMSAERAARRTVEAVRRAQP